MAIKRKRLWAGLSLTGLTLLPIGVSAATDQYTLWIEWTGGEGQKPMVMCNSGYFANGMENIDHGRSTQSANTNCRRIDEFLPAGTDVDHTSCQTVNVVWTPGAGPKPWAECPDGKYAVGFALYDYGGRNDGINKMRCCAIRGLRTTHENTYEASVDWWGGVGDKGFEYCHEGMFVTGIQLKDYGGNDQAVYKMRCTDPGF